MTNRVSTVEVIKPPITTVASGRCTSLPVPVENNKGINPNAVVSAEIRVLVVKYYRPMKRLYFAHRIKSVCVSGRINFND